MIGGSRPRRDTQHQLPANTTMEYIDVLWKHRGDEYPVRLVSELGEDRFELRKLEFFADGTVDAAFGDRETERTQI